jgi:hypothetical protein
MVNARYGLNLTRDEFQAKGKNRIVTEHAFNLAVGITNVHESHSELFEEPLPPHNVAWDKSGDEMDKFWNFYTLLTVSPGNAPPIVILRFLFGRPYTKGRPFLFSACQLRPSPRGCTIGLGCFTSD